MGMEDIVTRQTFQASIDRRTFNQAALGGAASLLAPASLCAQESPFGAPSLINGLEPDGDGTLPGGQWYIAEKTGAGLVYQFDKGALADGAYISSDLLVDGNTLVVFQIRLQEGEDGPAFTLNYKGLNQAQARIRMPLSVVDLNRWRLDREGAWLKPLCGGDRVDLAQVDRMIVRVIRKDESPARWMQTPFQLHRDQPEPIDRLLLPEGELLDELGQSTIHQWPGRTESVDAMVALLKRQDEQTATLQWPESFSRWGGWTKRLLDGTGYFRTHHDGDRWWLVDPDGYLFWSAGLDCVRAYIRSFTSGLETALSWLPKDDPKFEGVYDGTYMNYLAANFIRVFGKEAWHEKWAAISLSQMKNIGFNTIGNWSEWDIGRNARFPYVVPLSTRLPRSRMIYRDFPDVFHSDFALDAVDYAKQLEGLRGDPSLIGYFLMNEPTWGFSNETPAEGMLFNAPQCESRKALARHLGGKYGDSAALAEAWKMDVAFEDIAEGRWTQRLTREAKADLADFSEIMVERYFGSISDECRKVDPDHLNLGIRYAGVPPSWTLKGMSRFDVFSANSYTEKVPYDDSKKVSTQLDMPVIIGEWHFGALDAGLPASGIGRVKTQTERGRAYRVYFEDAAANPYCVGVHWFTMYDQSAMGRFDGENYNIGFFDVCNRPYLEISAAAYESHKRMYDIAAGDVKPFNDAPEYLPKLF